MRNIQLGQVPSLFKGGLNHIAVLTIKPDSVYPRSDTALCGAGQTKNGALNLTRIITEKAISQVPICTICLNLYRKHEEASRRGRKAHTQWRVPVHEAVANPGGKIEIFKAKDFKFYFRIRAKNGNILCTSKGHTRKDRAVHGVKTMMRVMMTQTAVLVGE